MRSLVWLLRAMVASVHALLGRLAYRLGRRHAARRQFERVLLLRGADFRAYVALGRIAFDLGDYATWRRELEHARRLDPRRFARLHHPLELYEPRLAGTTFDRLDLDATGFDGMRATWRTGRPSGPRLSPTAEPLDPLHGDTVADISASSPSPPPTQPPLPKRSPLRSPRQPAGDDCSSAAERERFQERGPIAADELRACDLDELLRRLSG